MKVLDRITVILFNLCLLLLTIIISAVSIAGSPAFYKDQFQKTGIYSKVENGVEYRRKIHYIDGGKYSDWATFSDEQIDEIIEHIISYLFTEQESFQLVMDNVNYKGTTVDGVSVFGETAVGHMVDVKELFNFFITLAWILGGLSLGLVGYFIWRRRMVKRLFLKYTLVFYGSFIGLILLFCGWALVTTLVQGVGMGEYGRILWMNLHHLFFPFQTGKFANSFFSDPLTEVLTLDFFLSAVYTVLAVVGIVLFAWLTFAVLCRVWTKRKEKCVVYFQVK